MRNIATGLLLISLISVSCSQSESIETVKPVQKHRQILGLNATEEDSRQKIVGRLSECLPDGWKIYGVPIDGEKLSLAYIGKAAFELHFKASYSVLDTLFAKQLAKKANERYVPEIRLHFYKYDEGTKAEARFAQENQLIISSISFAYDFGETP